MRNLKKVLSLVLALAMVLSICMVGAGAVNYDDFTDEESITKKQAVETLVSLDVINGYNDGAEFRPAGNVTRAEMATMICRVLAGGDNMIPNAVKEVPTYNDIRNDPSAAWAETYIEYCTSLGIVSGKGNGIFDPSADVTAAEAAKMIMTTLGYNADIEGFKGIGWDINTMAKASTLKLTDNLVGEISASAPMTREQVAQMLYNALDDPMVQYYEGPNANVWIGAGNVNDKYYETLLEAKFHAEKLTGVIEANEWADLYAETGIRKGTTRLALMDNGGDLTGETRVVEVSTNLLDIGQSVIVYWNKDTKRVLYGNTQDSGLNVISEIKTGYENIARGENAVNGSLTKDTQYFVNYDNNYAVDHESDYLIRYTASEMRWSVKTKDEAEDLVKALKALNGKGTITYKSDADGYLVTWEKLERTIRPGDPITVTDLDNINLIFSTADKWSDVDNGVPVYVYDAEVYVGTQSLDDISDTMSYKEFLRRYIIDEDNVLNREGFTESGYDANGARDLKNDNENGNYIRAIDFNNDGDIDYVLKIEFEMHEVANIGRNDVTLGKDKIDNSDLVTPEELSKGDIVITASIDGITYADLAPTFEGEVDSYNMRRDILTVDGTEYGQSAVLEDTQYPNLIAYAEKDVNYTYYQDHFGYIRVFAYPDDSANNYVLLTDGWFREKIDENEYAVKAYVDGEIKTFYTTSRARLGHPFINDTSIDSKNNSWGMLRGFNDYEDNDAGYPKYPESASLHNDATKGDQAKDTDGKAITNVVAYSLNDDDVMSLKDVKTWNYDKRHDKEEVDANYVNLVSAGKGLTSGQTEFTGYYIPDKGDISDTDSSIRVDASEWDTTVTPNDWTDVTVQATRDTVFYYVTREYDARAGRDVVKSVRTVTGYRNALNVAADEIEAMYAVATNTLQSAGQSREYWVADVIVVEVTGLTAEAKNAFFNIYANEKNRDEIATGDVILDTAATGTLTMRMGKTMDDFDKYTANGKRLPLGFYTKTDPDKDGVVTINLLDQYAKYGIYAAEVDRVTNLINYLTTEVDGKTKTFEYNKDEVTVYTLEGRDDDRYDDIKVDAKTRDAEGNKIAVDPGDKVIAVCNKSDVLYIIDVSKSDLPADVQTSVGKGLMTLWTAIEKANQDTSGAGDKVSKIEAAEKALEAYQKNQNATTLAALKAAYNDIKDMTVDGLTTDQANRLGTVRGAIEVLIGDSVAGDTAANTLVEKYNAWVKTNADVNATPAQKTAARDAMYAAAVAYKPSHDAGEGTADGDEAYDNAVAMAFAAVSDFKSKMVNVTTFGAIADAISYDITSNMETLAKESAGWSGISSDYSTAKTNFATWEPRFEKAKKMVEEYVKVAGQIGADWTDAIKAFTAITGTEHDAMTALTDSGYVGTTPAAQEYKFGVNNDYGSAFEAVRAQKKILDDAADAEEEAKPIDGVIKDVNLKQAMVTMYGATMDKSHINDTENRRVIITLSKKTTLPVNLTDPVTGTLAYALTWLDWTGTGDLWAYWEYCNTDINAGMIHLSASGKNSDVTDGLNVYFRFAPDAKFGYSAEITETNGTAGTVKVTVTCDTDATSTAQVTNVTVKKMDTGVEGTIGTATPGSLLNGTADFTVTAAGAISAGDYVYAEVTVDGQTIKTDAVVVVTGS